MQDLNFRIAQVSDAPVLAECILEVSQGVADLLLANILPNVAAKDMLITILQDSSSHYSCTNCLLAEDTNSLKGLLFSYDAKHQEIPQLLHSLVPHTTLALFSDFLTAALPNSLYINTIWVDKNYRGYGLADTLMVYAKYFAKALELSSLSLFVLQDNLRAQAFYKRHGFKYLKQVSLPAELVEMHGGGGLWGVDL